jgi:uncharacterized protein (TIGR02186 family)
MKWLVLFLLLITPVHAERLVLSLSTHRVMIQSNFTGGELVLFGLIERDGMTIGRGSGYDVVVNVRGQSYPLLMREKKRLLGIYVNQNERILPASPQSLLTVSNKKLDDILDKEAQVTARVGYKSVLSDFEKDTYRQELLLSRHKKGAYRDMSNGVTFVTSQLFRARVPIPANSSVGEYEVEVALFSGGVTLAKANTNFEIVKTGVEAYISRQAKDNSWVYGAFVLFLALSSGYLAHLIFRKD